MSFGPLRVWNDDSIQPGTGFVIHGHRDMEIITYVRRGAITHKDHLGNVGKTGAGDIQVMSAGTGIMHAEFNLEEEETLLFQIWVVPDRTGLAPRWEAKPFPKGSRNGKFVPLASGESQYENDIDVLHINQDATLYGANLEADASISHLLKKGRRAYLVPSEGEITVNGQTVTSRAGVAVEDVDTIDIIASDQTDILLLDLP